MEPRTAAWIPDSRSGWIAAASVCLAAGLCVPATATSFVPPRDPGELAAASEAVVLARAGAPETVRRGAIAWTASVFTVIESVSGPFLPGDGIEVEVPGGRDGDERFVVAGSPEFEPGASYLLCLARKGNGTWTPRLLAWGLLIERRVADRDLLVPVPEAREMIAFPRADGGGAGAPEPFERDGLLRHLRAVVGGEASWDSAAVRPPIDIVEALEPEGAGAAIPGECTYLTADTPNFRWRTFDSKGTLKIRANGRGDPSVPDGGFHLVQDALDLWMDIPGTSMNMLFDGARRVDACGGEPGFILFDDPCSEIADLSNCGGILAYGGGSVSGTYSFGGNTWATMVSWFVVVNNGVGCIGTTGYTRMLAHELGHGVGFGHSPDGSALMYGTCCNAINGTDRTCATFTYPASDPANVRPEVDAGGDRTLTLLGGSALLRGAVTDDGLPAPARITQEWIWLAGPAQATFDDPLSLETRVTFPLAGTYLIGLVASDGALVRMDQARIEVTAGGSGTTALDLAQGTSGYQGTVDTLLSEASPTANGSALEELSADADDPSGSGRRVQSLLRFEGLFDPGRIAPGAVIRSAVLELTSTNGGDGAALHRMLLPWDDADGWSGHGPDGVEPGREAASAPDAAIVGPGTGLVRLDVTESLNAWSRDPCSSHGWAFLPLGGDGWRFSSAESDAPPRLLVEVSGAGRDAFVATGDTWSILEGLAAPPAAWRQLDFVADTEWMSGPSGIGYADGDDATILDGMQGSYAAIFCRREFTVRALPTALVLRIDYDDGFVAYLNGTEVARSSNLGPAGRAVAWSALASSGREAGTFEEHAIDPARLRPGENVLAIEVHNSAIDSSDLSCIPELIGSSVLLPGGSEWRFLRGSATIPSGWASPTFDDSAWEAGTAGIGYGDGDDATELADMRDAYAAVFCRRAFEVSDPSDIGSVILDIVHDDGFVAYLNGTEIARVNMPSGSVTRATLATSSIEPTRTSVSVPPGRLRSGDNVLAVSVHNAALDSSDLSFDALVGAGQATSGTGCDGRFRRGDATNDGSVDISDPVLILLHLFAGGPDLECPDAADADDDGAIDLADAVALLGYLFRGGSPPAAPGPACGPDPTEDALAACAPGC